MPTMDDVPCSCEHTGAAHELVLIPQSDDPKGPPYNYLGQCQTPGCKCILFLRKDWRALYGLEREAAG